MGLCNSHCLGVGNGGESAETVAIISSLPSAIDQAATANAVPATASASGPSKRTVSLELPDSLKQRGSPELQDVDLQRQISPPPSDPPLQEAPNLPETPCAARAAGTLLAEEEPTARAATSGLAAEAEAEAVKLMTQCCVLEAEKVLAAALQRLNESAAADSAAAAGTLRGSRVYAEVKERLRQYLAIGEILKPSTMRLCWEKDGSRLWVHAPVGATWFEFKIATDIDAPLSYCLAYANELDILPKYEPMLVGAPEFLGPVCTNLLVTRALIGLLLFRIELLFEVFRVTDEKFGFLAESIRADFPPAGRPIPERHWRYKRMCIDTKNLWIPHGGEQKGTSVIQATRVDVGFRIPEYVLSYFIYHFAGGMVGNVQKNSSRALQPGSPWEERLVSDQHGLYAQCRKAEAAARKREPTSAATLPTDEIFQRVGPSLTMP